jgi:hypothetical protein
MRDPFIEDNLRVLLVAAENVACQAWGTSVTKQYHHERIRHMEKLREVIRDVRNAMEQREAVWDRLEAISDDVKEGHK